MHKTLLTLLVISFSVIFTGCASIVTGSNQSVSVETPGCVDATCKLTNDKGAWFVNNTPGSVTVHRAYGDLTVVCSKKGYEADNIVAVKSSTKGMAYGNILVGGIIGAGVDTATGAAYDYPTTITVPMDCSDDNAKSNKIPLQVAAPAQNLSVSYSNESDTTAIAANQINDCVELEQKMENAKDKPFTLKVLQENYKNRCKID